MDTATSPPRLRTRLPHVLATLYGIAIVYASLEPFHPWLPPQTSFFLFDFGSARWIRYDALLNVLSYVPFGFFVALLRRGVSPTRRIVHSVVIGAAMSFAMESLQMYVPPRVASPFDLAANIVGALGGGALATVLAYNQSTRDSIYGARTRLFLPGPLGDVGLALMLLWLVAQTNPGIPLFAVTFDNEVPTGPALIAAPPVHDDASTVAHENANIVVQAAGTGFQVLGVGLFAALLLRRRRHAGSIVVALIAGALLLERNRRRRAAQARDVAIVGKARRVDRCGNRRRAACRRDRAAASGAGGVVRDRVAVGASRAGAGARIAERASAARDLRLALRSAAELQRPDPRGAARLAAAGGGMAVRARGATVVGQATRSRMIEYASGRPL